MKKFLHAFHLVPGINFRILKKIWFHFQNWQYAWEMADIQAFLELGLREELISQLLLARKKINVDSEYEKLWRQDIVAISKDDREFPEILKQIPDPPFLLYRKGAPLTHSPQNHVAIVGTRRSTFYGEKIARTLAEAIAEQGGIVVSGLAFGIDAVAHFGAVNKQKPTIAFLPSSLMNVTPSSHILLSEKILEQGGTLLSEYAQDEDFHKNRFLERNRLISGLCQATVVIEADIKSGALITAQKALEQGRDVYALPGDIGRPQTQGCLKLIGDGAYPIINLNDLLLKLGFNPFFQKKASLSKQEKILLKALQAQPSSNHELAQQEFLPTHQLNVTLSTLELKGIIKKNKAGQWESC